MSKENKFNPGIYTQAGRLSPDDTARERKKQGTAAGTKPPPRPSRKTATSGRRRRHS